MGHDWCKKMWTPFSACPVSRDFASTILKVANIHRILQKHCKDSLFAQDHACCTNSGTFHGMQTILQKPVCHARQKLNQKNSDFTPRWVLVKPVNGTLCAPFAAGSQRVVQRKDIVTSSPRWGIKNTMATAMTRRGHV